MNHYFVGYPSAVAACVRAGFIVEDHSGQRAAFGQIQRQIGNAVIDPYYGLSHFA